MTLSSPGLGKTRRGEPWVTGTQSVRAGILHLALSSLSVPRGFLCYIVHGLNLVLLLSPPPHYTPSPTPSLLPSALSLSLSLSLLCPPPPCWLPGRPHLTSALSLCPQASTLCPWSEPDVRQGLAGVHRRMLLGRRRSSVSRSPSSGRLLILHLSPCQPWTGQYLTAALPVSGAAGYWLLAFLSLP